MENIINIKLAGSFLRADSNVLGIQGEANSKKLTIYLSGAWTDCSAVTVFFDDADGAAAAQVLLINADPSKGGNLIADATYQIGVPSEVLRSPGKVLVTFKGFNEQAKEIRKAFKRFEVIENHAVYPASSEPTPTLSEQLVNLITGAFQKLFCKPVNINPENNHWMIWNPNTEQYEDSGISSVNIVDASGNLVTGSITTGYLADKSVTNAKLTDGAVTANKLTDGAVTINKLADRSVATQKIALGAVTGDELADCSVARDKLTQELANTIPNYPWDIDSEDASAGWVLALGTVDKEYRIIHRKIPPDIMDQVNNGAVTVANVNGWQYHMHVSSGHVFAAGTFDLGRQSLSGNEASNKISATFSVPLPFKMVGLNAASVQVQFGERESTYGGVNVHDRWFDTVGGNDCLKFRLERVENDFTGYANVVVTAFISGYKAP